MKQNLRAFAMCQSMFCAFPTPIKAWDEDARGRMLLFLPFVGLEIGLLWALLAWGCIQMNFPTLITGILLCIYPFLATGFIHLDGFMDVTDAVKSWRDLDRRREILKDSHVGSFAVVGCIMLMLTQFAFLASLKDETDYRILILIPVVSRCCSALAVSVLPSLHTSEYAEQEKPRSQIFALIIILGLTLAAGFFFFQMYGFALIGGLTGYGLGLLRGYRSLKGMNGDISGFALTISELVAIAVMVLI